MKVKDIGELALIDKIRQEIGFSDKLFIPIGDDTAAFELRPPFFTLLTTDSQVKDVHFIIDKIPAEDLGFKSVSINVSDIAAMAGIPKYAVIALGLEPDLELDYVLDLYKGMRQAADLYNLTLAGGDISSSKTFFINITILGEVEPSLIRRRDEAEPGHLIYVTGKLGGSSAGLAIQSKGFSFSNKEQLIKRHNHPIVKIEEARLASENGAKAMEDISDGLITEIKHICNESSVGAVLEAERIPIEASIDEVAKKLNTDSLQLALGGGEDYELVFTIPKNQAPSLEKIFGLEKKELYKIGYIIKGENISVIDSKGNSFPYTEGWEHLAR